MDIIESIKLAEDNALAIKHKATLDAQKVITEKEKEAKEEASVIIAEAKKEAEKMTADSKAEAEKEAEKILEAGKADILALENKAKENFEKAAKKFISLVEA